MLNRFRISFDDIYHYATQQPQSLHLEQALANADKDRSESNLETLNQYRYIYCNSDNTFASHVGREAMISAKSYGLSGLKAAAVGIGAGVGASFMTVDKSSFDVSSAVTPSSSAKAFAILSIGGVVLGSIIGGAHAIYTRSQNRLLKTSEEKERVGRLLGIAENRVAFFHGKSVKTNPIKKVIPHDNDDRKDRDCAFGLSPKG